MSFDYPEFFVGDVCSVGDGAHSKVVRVQEGIPYLTSKNIGQGVLKLDNYDCISDVDFNRLFPVKSSATRRPIAGDILIGIIGTFGNAYLYKDGDCFGFSSSIGIIRPNKEILNSKFLYYVLTSQKFRTTHLNYNAGSVQGYTNIPTIKKLKVPIPPLTEQKEIASILSALDNRISLLRETNTTLESIAQTLFKSWFVDFDPVKAKAEGRLPEGMSDATAALFPSEFKESALGLIPKGWRVGVLSDCCQKVESGGTPKRNNSEYWDGDIGWLTSGEVRNLIVLDTKEKITLLGVKDSSAKIWPVGTTVVAMYGATAGEICLLAKAVTANQACCGLIPLSEARAFLFFITRRESKSLADKSSGSAQQNLNKGLVSNHTILLPPLNLMAVFESVAGALIDKW